MYKALYFEEVFTDVQKAKEWYKEQQADLEIRFAICIEEAIMNFLQCPLLIMLDIKM